MDRTPPRLEPYPCPACHLFRRENSGIKNACTTKNLLVCRQRISILRYRKKKIYYTCFTLLQGVYTEFGTASCAMSYFSGLSHRQCLRNMACQQIKYSLRCSRLLICCKCSKYNTLYLLKHSHLFKLCKQRRYLANLTAICLQEKNFPIFV